MKRPADDSAQATFDVIGNMETPLHRAADLSLALLRIGAELDDNDDSAIICSLAALVLENCRAAEGLRGEAFKLTHPRREHFEKAGWLDHEHPAAVDEAAAWFSAGNERQQTGSI